MRLGALAAARGYRLEARDEVGSTNDVAMTRAREGDEGGLWIVAATQTGGRGRRGRTWVSPPGNLHASLLLLDPAPIARAPQLGFVAGVALCRALESLGVPAARLRLKWPNDALLDGAKLSGILLESTTTPDGRFACVMGLGVNCVAHPRDLPYVATDLASAGVDLSRERVFASLSDALAAELEAWRGGDNQAALRVAWLERAAAIGSPIEVSLGDRRVTGLFRGIDAEGRLVLAGPTGDMVVDAGDVTPLASAGARGASA